MAEHKKGMIDWLQLGTRIADMRRSRGMTQQELAEHIGHSDVYVGYLEQGKRHGTLETFINIVNVLGYTMDDLLDSHLEHKEPVSFDTLHLVETCTPKERELILHMVHVILDYTRSQILDNKQIVE